MEDSRLVAFRREDQHGDIIGNIYAGQVAEAVPAYPASFIEIGLERHGFLSRELLRPQSPVLVQVTGNERGQKGVRLSTSIQLSGAFCVLLPGRQQIGISHKILDKKEQERLRRIGEEMTEEFRRNMPEFSFGLILRTDAASAASSEIEADASGLFQRWNAVWNAFRTRKPGASRLLYQAGDFIQSLFRLYPAGSFQSFVVDDPAFAESFPGKYGIPPEKVSCYPSNRTYDLFAAKGIEQKLEKLLQRKVWLNSGAYLILDRTEAMMVIDVNSGKHDFSRTPQEFAWKVNLEAAREIMRQLRLRDLGGMILCDFIDMESEEHRLALLEDMRSLALLDPGNPCVVDMTSLGLVEITRKRTI